MYKKIIIATVVSCFFIGAILSVFSSQFFAQAFHGSKDVWFYTLLITGFVVSLLIGFFERKYPTEFSSAEKISYTSKNKYGLYALIYFIVLVILSAIYIVIKK